VTKARLATSIAVLLAAIGTWEVASAAWIHAKGWLAQELIAFAWSRARVNGASASPWPGADLKPVARLSVPSRGVQVYVLDEAHARALAFGPAHLGNTAQPGAAGNSVIVAHRDTHFSFLRTLAVNDTIDLESRDGSRSRYRVREMRVVDKGELDVIEPSSTPRLTLVTCYPFDAVRPGTPLRYVVVADRMA
jgi:sortase A